MRTGLEYVPPRRQRELVQRVLDELLVDGGRLIIGTYHGETGRADSQERELWDWGFRVVGHTSRPHRDDRLVYRAVWIDA